MTMSATLIPSHFVLLLLLMLIWYQFGVLLDDEEAPAPPLIDFGVSGWVDSMEGGHYNPKQEIRHEDPEDPKSIVGVFAHERIEQGELLTRVPWEAIIMPEEDYEPFDKEAEELSSLECATARKLAKEMKLGKDSWYAPYVLYLLNQAPDQLPSAWSVQGKNLLRYVLGGTSRRPLIPPAYAMTWLEEDWFQTCGGDNDDALGAHAAMLVIQRADDELMVPAYDFYNHRNGYFCNTVSRINHEESHEVRASRTIEAGEQIYLSYNFCTDCGGRKHRYGTPELFRDYGFVERFPQRWPLSRTLTFDLHEKLGDNGEVLDYEVEWIPQLKQETAGEKNHISSLIHVLTRQSERVDQVRRTAFRNLELFETMPRQEWNVIWKYADAVVRAYSLAMNQLVEGKETSVSPSNEL